MRTTFKVGDLTIQRIVEQEVPLFDPLTFLPDLTPEILAENRAWLEQAGALDPATSYLVLCVQSYVVRTPHHTVLIDTCVGNHKERPARPFWHQQTSTTYMDGLAAHGLRVEDIDYVMCTHLHADHVGWNTKLLDGRWVPTFPNARYVFSKKEFDYWVAENAREEVGPIADSVLPIVNANRADLVASDYRLGDHIRMTPTPGHTPDHVAVVLGKGPHPFAAADALPRDEHAGRFRPQAGIRDPAHLPRMPLRHGHPGLHRAFPLALGRQDHPAGRQLRLHTGVMTPA
jgi:glyoxylase-like metal-dependent hydrolase (beta-lactamase superfamily II)